MSLTDALTNISKTTLSRYRLDVASGDIEGHYINIGNKFATASLNGPDSQAVTLCHEMSHFRDVLGTEDIAVDNKNFSQTVTFLSDTGDDDAFKNAYNFERYFE